MAAIAWRSQRSASSNQPRAAHGRPATPVPPVASGGQLGRSPLQAVGEVGHGPGDGDQGRPLDPGRRVLVLLQAAQQDRVGAEQVAQAGQELGGVGRPDLPRLLGLGQAEAPSRRATSTASRSGWTTTQRIRTRQPSSLMGARYGRPDGAAPAFPVRRGTSRDPQMRCSPQARPA
jgi:hypothetical protein